MCMEILRKTREYTVKIRVNNDTSTGVIFAPESHEYLYVFTTLHSIEGFFNDEKPNPDVTFYFLDKYEKMRIHNPEEVLGQYPHQLSGGMLQRIMIGLALAMKPALLVADEPTTAIDAITQAEILKEFQRIKEESHTAMIFISHDLGAVSKIADEIVVMNGGKLVEQGDFEHILRHAKDPYTRMLAETRRSVMERYRLCLDNQEELCLN